MNSLVAFTPFVAAALVASASAATPPQNTQQDVGRLVLLPGPYLTSPAKGAPQPTPVVTASDGMVKIGNDSLWTARPALTAPKSAAPTSVAPAPASAAPAPANGMVKVGDESRWTFRPGSPSAAPRNPADLRFDAQLPAPPQSTLLKQKTPPAADPAPERQ